MNHAITHVIVGLVNGGGSHCTKSEKYLTTHQTLLHANLVQELRFVFREIMNVSSNEDEKA